MGVNSAYSFDSSGIAVARVNTTPNADRQRVEVQVLPTEAIPNIFIPGILGSPLRSLGRGHLITIFRNNPWAWFPYSTYRWVAGYGWSDGYADLTPAQRQQLLDPEATEALGPYDVDADKAVRKAIKKALKISRNTYTANGINIQADKLFSVQEALRRGWTTVDWGTYGNALVYLETKLRHLTYSNSVDNILHRGNITPIINYTATNHVQAFQKDFSDSARAPTERMSDVLTKTINYHYPVFAVGYNWLRCNEEGADYVHNRRQQIINYVKAPRRATPDPRGSINVPIQDSFGLGLSCDDGVILVTHSMGGLLGRMLAKKYPDIVRGVYHSVQPCDGSATLYGRIRGGWEGDGVKGYFTGLALAEDGAELVPVLGNAPGGMQLAPNQNYAANWLQIRDQNSHEIFSLPTAGNDGKCDPYGDIYLEENLWWKLTSPALINPLQEINNNDAWRKYANVVATAQLFHENLNNYFHPNTYLSYCSSSDHQTWGKVTWKLRPYELKTYTSDYETLDTYTLRNYTNEIVSPDVAFNATTSSPSVRGGTVDLDYASLNYPIEATLERGNDNGDGTVPFNSANPWKSATPWEPDQQHAQSMPDNIPIQVIFELGQHGDDFDHAASYDNNFGLENAFYSLLCLIGKERST